MVGELGAAMRMLQGGFPTCIMQVDYPIHKGQPNPKHGKFYMVGSIPGACYDVATNHSFYYDTEQEAIDAAINAGATRIQDTKCRFVVGK